jgi:hypothetical protein
VGDDAGIGSVFEDLEVRSQQNAILPFAMTR